MRRVRRLGAAGVLVAAACAPAPQPYGSVCRNSTAPCESGGGTAAIGGGGVSPGSDAGTTANGEPDAESLTSINVTGVVSSVRVLPASSSSAIAVANTTWSVVAFGVADAIEAPLDASGTFTLLGVPVMDGVARIRVIAPMGMQTLSTLVEIPATQVSETVNPVAVPTTVLEDAITLAGITADELTAHLVVQLNGGASGGLSGFQLSVVDSTGRRLGATYLYDTGVGGGFTSVTGATGAGGTALAVNIPASAAGVSVTAQVTNPAHAVQSYPFLAVAATIEWLSVTAP